LLNIKSTWKHKRWWQAQNKASIPKTRQASQQGSWLACLVGLPALLACLPCWPACLVGLPALSACLLYFLPSANTCSLKWIFLAGTNISNKAKQRRQCVPLISLFNMMSMCVQHETLCKYHLRGRDCIHHNLMIIIKKGVLNCKSQPER
jgi:hypothetical protein